MRLALATGFAAIGVGLLDVWAGAAVWVDGRTDPLAWIGLVIGVGAGVILGRRWGEPEVIFEPCNNAAKRWEMF